MTRLRQQDYDQHIPNLSLCYNKRLQNIFLSYFTRKFLLMTKYITVYDNYHSQRERRALASPLSYMHFKKPPLPSSPRRITLDGINKKWMGNTAAKLSVPSRLTQEECCNSRYAQTVTLCEAKANSKLTLWVVG